jgi:APA family basic amino acid/polyamine antiporter
VRDLRLRDATLLVVSGTIGSGIFLTPAVIAGQLPDPRWILAAWALGGLLSLAGALANAELGAMFPHAGGDYVYLREAFHPLAGFAVGWLSFFVIYAGTIATVAAGFADALAAFVPMSEGERLAVAIGLTLFVSWINYLGVRWGAFANNLTGVLKVVGLVVFALAAPFAAGGDVSHLFAGEAATVSPWAALGVVLTPVLFSYLGWNSSIYVASEIRDPRRNVPRSLFLGLGICTGVYLLVNLAYLYALPMEALRSEPNTGEAAARVLFGAPGAVVVGLFALASIFGTLNATVLVGPRIAYAMAIDGLFFRGVDRAHAGFRTPVAAIVAQAVVVVGILLTLGTFERALGYTTFAILLATIADVAALYRLRWARPEADRPYRAWGYPWVPAVYILANAGVAAALLVAQPLECGIGLAIALTALPFYAWFARDASEEAAS